MVLNPQQGWWVPSQGDGPSGRGFAPDLGDSCGLQPAGGEAHCSAVLPLVAAWLKVLCGQTKIVPWGIWIPSWCDQEPLTWTSIVGISRSLTPPCRCSQCGYHQFPWWSSLLCWLGRQTSKLWTLSSLWESSWSLWRWLNAMLWAIVWLWQALCSRLPYPNQNAPETQPVANRQPVPGMPHLSSTLLFRGLLMRTGLGLEWDIAIGVGTPRGTSAEIQVISLQIPDGPPGICFSWRLEMRTGESLWSAGILGAVTSQAGAGSAQDRGLALLSVLTPPPTGLASPPGAVRTEGGHTLHHPENECWIRMALTWWCHHQDYACL